jgi:hypothetical protein
MNNAEISMGLQVYHTLTDISSGISLGMVLLDHMVVVFLGN